MANDTLKPTRDNIPRPMRRDIRRRCGFGCVICGHVLYEYDHMLHDWANVREHVAEDITLLCPNHHAEKTKGLIPKEQVIKANNDPYNLQSQLSNPYLLNFSGNNICVRIFNNTLSNTSPFKIDAGYYLPMLAPVVIDGIALISFMIEDERLLLNVNLYDEFNELIFVVIENELVFKPDTWDVEFIGRRLILREAHRNIILDLEFNVPNELIVHRAKIRFNGVELHFSDKLWINEKNIPFNCAGNYIATHIGISVGNLSNLPLGFINIDKINRYKRSL